MNICMIWSLADDTVERAQAESIVREKAASGELWKATRLYPVEGRFGLVVGIRAEYDADSGLLPASIRIGFVASPNDVPDGWSPVE